MRSSTLPAHGRLHGTGAPAAMVLTIAVGILVQGCPSTRKGPVVPESAEAGFYPIDGDAYVAASADDLQRQALDGASLVKEATLDARMQVRPLRMPKPPRGASARFDVGDGRRGWVTTMPNEQLLNTPAFARGRVVLGGGFASHELYALDATTGALAFTVAAPDGGPSSAIVEEDRIIFNTESCEIFVADAETGKLLWHKWLGDPLMSQPTAKQGLVFSAYPVNGGHELGAFRLRDGEPVWKSPIGADVIAAPQVSGDSVYFATMDGAAYRLRRRDGHVVWSAQVGASSAPTIDGDRLLLSRKQAGKKGATEQPVVLSTNDGKITSEGERFEAPYFAGNTRDRTMAKSQLGAWGTVVHGEHLGLVNVAAGWAYQGSTPSVADGRAYFAIGGEIRAREVATARELWRRSYAQAKDAQAVSPPAVVGSQLVFGTVDGHLYGVDIDTGMTIWAYDVGEPVVYQPIVAQGWLYFTTGKGRVVGLEMGDPTFDGWHMWGGNAEHAGLVEHAGTIDPRTLASLERPASGTMRLAHIEDAATEGTGTRQTSKAAKSKSVQVGAAKAKLAAEPDKGPRAQVKDEPRLPLAGTRVRAEVSGFVARVHVAQTFDNPYDRPIEAQYLFPLPPDAAVDAMEMRVGARVIRAKIDKRAEAQKTYADARAAGKRAALLEQQRPDLFAERVANIQPGERIEVELHYAQTLPFDNGEYSFSFPMASERSASAPADSVGTPHTPGSVGTPHTPVQIDLAIDAGMPIARVGSPTHAVETTQTGQRATVHLPKGAVADKDFVVRYALGGAVPNAALLAHREGDTGWFSLVVQPPTDSGDAATVARDVTIAVDTSSSMRGRPLEQARAVAHEIAAGLRPNDAIRVVAFSDRVSASSPQPELANAETAARVKTFVDGMRPSGTSDAAPAIREALGPRREGLPGRMRLVVLVTDGYLGNEADVLRGVAEQLGDARVFTVGVGAAPNRFLLERAAEIGRGHTVTAALSDPPDRVAQQLHSLVDRPLYTDVAIDWNGLDVDEVYPRRIPDLFAAKPLVVTGRFHQGGRVPIRIRGTWGGRRYQRVIDVDLPAPSAASAAADQTLGHAAQRVLWARAAVHDRMNKIYLRDDPKLVDEVTRLGLEHRLVTPWTSFVAVDDAPAQAKGNADATAGAPDTQTILSPARALPGDPEIRIAAPSDARAVTVVLPFGETVDAGWEPELGVWVARFLIPRDAAEGNHSVRVLITNADGSQERRTTGYTVDSAAPRVRVEVIGEARPGSLVTLRAEQIVTDADRAQAGLGSGTLAPERAQLLADTRRIELRTPAGEVIEMAQTARRVWQTRWRIPEGAKDQVALRIFAVDLAANVREQALTIPVHP